MSIKRCFKEMNGILLFVEKIEILLCFSLSFHIAFPPSFSLSLSFPPSFSYSLSLNVSAFLCPTRGFLKRIRLLLWTKIETILLSINFRDLKICFIVTFLRTTSPLTICLLIYVKFRNNERMYWYIHWRSA